MDSSLFATKHVSPHICCGTIVRDTASGHVISFNTRSTIRLLKMLLKEVLSDAIVVVVEVNVVEVNVIEVSVVEASV